MDAVNALFACGWLNGQSALSLRRQVSDQRAFARLVSNALATILAGSVSAKSRLGLASILARAADQPPFRRAKRRRRRPLAIAGRQRSWGRLLRSRPYKDDWYCSARRIRHSRVWRATPWVGPKKAGGGRWPGSHLTRMGCAARRVRDRREVCSKLVCRAARQPHREHRALAQFAGYRHVAAHHARELARDDKAKAGPAVALRRPIWPA
jgi:hypothetical protein